MGPSSGLKIWSVVFYASLLVWFVVALNWFLRVAQEVYGLETNGLPFSSYFPESLTLMWATYWYTLISTGLIFMNWQARALQQVQPEGTQPTRFSADAVAWWLCPGLNFWKPRQVMRWLWKRATGKADSGWIGWWWWLWLAVLCSSWALYGVSRLLPGELGGTFLLQAELLQVGVLEVTGLMMAAMVHVITKHICWRLEKNPA